MTIARLTSIVEAVTGQTPTAAQVGRVGNRLYALTESPDPDATNAQKASAAVALIRQHLRGMNRDGAEALERESSISVIQSAAEAAAGDL